MKGLSSTNKIVALILPIFVLACALTQTATPLVTRIPGSPPTTTPTTSKPIEPTLPPKASPTVPSQAIDLASAILPKATLLLNMDLTSPPQMALDGHGILHVLWYSDGKLMHIQRNTDGSWSEVQAIVDDPYLMHGVGGEPRYFTLLTSPENNVCVLWREFPNHVKERCSADGQWAEAKAVSDKEEFGSNFVAAYAPDGTLQVMQNVFPFGEEHDEHFTIDKNGGYHLVWIDKRLLYYKYSKDQGATWTTPMTLSDEIFEPWPIFFLRADKLGNVHLTWKSNHLLYYRHWSSEKGWGEIERIFGDEDKDVSLDGSDLAVDAHGKAYIVAGFDSYLGKGKAWASVGYMVRGEDGKWLGPTPVAKYEYDNTQRWTAQHPIMLAGDNDQLLFVWQAPNNDLNFAQVP
jgi:hypothetical protein